jgi:uncharacterized protein YodC (DUF2158 family)
MSEFKQGDIVQLNSGGPKMTVAGFHKDGSVFCQWFAGSKLQDGYFQKISLKPVKKEQ